MTDETRRRRRVDESGDELAELRETVADLTARLDRVEKDPALFRPGFGKIVTFPCIPGDTQRTERIGPPSGSLPRQPRIGHRAVRG